MWAHRWRLFRRRAGNPLSLLIGLLLLWMVHHLAGRVQAHWPLGAKRSLVAGLGLLVALAVGLAWQRIFRNEQENDFYLLQPIPSRALARLWLLELGVALLLPTLALSVGLWRLFADVLLATVPLAWLPAIVGLALAESSRYRVPWIFGLVCLTAELFSTPVLLLCGLPGLLWLKYATVQLNRHFRPRYAGRRRTGRVRTRAGSRMLRGLLRPLPIKVAALIQADVLYLVRGGFLRGRVALVLLLPISLAYLAWPIPPHVRHAPMVISSMLLTFILAGVGFVLGADLSRAELPHLPFKRLTPVSGRTIWWARQLLALATCTCYGTLFSATLFYRHGIEAIPLLPVMAIITVVVSTYTVAFSLAVSGQVDMTAASSIAFGAVVMAFLALTVYMWQPLILLAYPLTLVRLYGRGVERFRQVAIG